MNLGFSPVLGRALILACLSLLPPLAGSARSQEDPVHQSRRLLQEGKSVAAAALLDEFLKSHSDSAEAWLERARCFDKSPMGVEQALAAVNRALKLSPRFAPALEFRGLLEVGRKNWEKAEADFNLGIELEPARSDLNFFRGYCRFQRGEFQAAVSDYSRSIELNPGDDSTWNFRGQAHRELQAWEQAVADFTQALRLNPSQAEYWMNRGRLWLARGEPRRAVADFSVAIEKNPNNGVAWNQRSLAYLQTGQRGYAHRDADRSVALLPGDPNCLCVRGMAASRLGKVQAAIDDFTAALAIDPGHLDSLLQRGIEYGNMAQFPLAELDFRHVNEIAPGFAAGWNHLGVVSLRQMKFEEAISAQTRAVELEPDNALYVRNRGAFAADRGRWNEAAADFDTCISRKSSTAEDFYESMLVAIAREDRTRATQIASQAQRRFGDSRSNDEVQHRAAIALLGESDDDLRGLVEHLVPADRGNPPTARQAILAGLALIRLRQPEQAQGLLEDLESLPDAEQAAADGATALALARRFRGDEARKRIAAGRRRLKEIRPPTMPPPTGYRMTWQARVFAEWVLDQAESAL